VNESHLILGIGELLWDMLPNAAQLGGAPANYAVMASQLGNHAVILSRIGRDDLGRDSVFRLNSLPVDTSFLQVDSAHQTGRVSVEFHDNQPSYTIHQPAAWDYLELSDEWVKLAERANAICFGSLAQRNPIARQTIQTLVAQTQAQCLRVFDVNLRPPFYSSEVIQESLKQATVIKMNDAELPLVIALLGLPADESQDHLLIGARRLLHEFSTLQMVAVTCGAQGSLLVTRNDSDRNSGIPIKVADTIGAGDAFTAALTHHLLLGANLSTTNLAGNLWGGWVASQSGAMPVLSDQVRTEITGNIAMHATNSSLF